MVECEGLSKMILSRCSMCSTSENNLRIIRHWIEHWDIRSPRPFPLCLDFGRWKQGEKVPEPIPDSFVSNRDLDQGACRNGVFKRRREQQCHLRYFLRGGGREMLHCYTYNLQVESITWRAVEALWLASAPPWLGSSRATEHTWKQP